MLCWVVTVQFLSEENGEKKSFLDTNKTHIQVYRSVRIMKVSAFWMTEFLIVA